MEEYGFDGVAGKNVSMMTLVVQGICTEFKRAWSYFTFHQLATLETDQELVVGTSGVPMYFRVPSMPPVCIRA